MENLANTQPKSDEKPSSSVWLFEYEMVIDPGNEHSHTEYWNCNKEEQSNTSAEAK